MVSTTASPRTRIHLKVLAVATVVFIGLLAVLTLRKQIPAGEKAAFQELVAQLNAKPQKSQFFIEYRCKVIATCSLSYDRNWHGLKQDKGFGERKSAFDLHPDALKQMVKTGRY